MTRFAPLTLLSITVIWGWTFVLVKQGMSEVGPLTFLAARFLIAFLVLAGLMPGVLRRIDRSTLRAGAVIGVALFGGYLFQTWGLVYTTATKSGLITGLSVVIVPLLAAAVNRNRVGLKAWIGAFLAAGGLALLVLGRGRLSPVNFGDFLTLICAVSYAAHIVLVDRYVRRVDYRGLLLVQVGTVAALSTVGALLFESLPTRLSGGLIEGILVTGVLATALALYILNRFQSYSTAAYTAIILTMEPVFAALFGAILLGETLGPLQIAGAVVIVVSTLIPKLSVRPARTGR